MAIQSFNNNIIIYIPSEAVACPILNKKRSLKKKTKNNDKNFMRRCLQKNYCLPRQS